MKKIALSFALLLSMNALAQVKLLQQKTDESRMALTIYNISGKPVSAIYFVSKDIQYMFGPEKEFQGIWYKDKMYDTKGKQVLIRSNW